MEERRPLQQEIHGNLNATSVYGDATVIHQYPPTQPQDQKRILFLARLRYRYKEAWDQSLQGAALIELGLIEKPDAVPHTTDLLFHMDQQPEHHLSSETSLLQVYNDCGYELLILGGPGAGKSTLLLTLARQLVERAEHDAGHLFPVIISLSSWARKQLPRAGLWNRLLSPMISLAN